MTEDDRKMVSELADRVFDLAELTHNLSGLVTPLDDNIALVCRRIQRRTLAIGEHFAKDKEGAA